MFGHRVVAVARYEADANATLLALCQIDMIVTTGASCYELEAWMLVKKTRAKDRTKGDGENLSIDPNLT